MEVIMGFEIYLTESVNQMHSLSLKADIAEAKGNLEQENDYILQAALTGCNILKRLTDDPDFRRTIGELVKARFDPLGNELDEFKSITKDIETLESFLLIEREILIKGGMFPDVANQVVDISRYTLEQVKRFTPASEVIDRVGILRDQACSLANELVTKANESRRWEGIKGKVSTIMKGIGGAAMIGFNAAAAVTYNSECIFTSKS
jgi:hypothetical protein